MRPWRRSWKDLGWRQTGTTAVPRKKRSEVNLAPGSVRGLTQEASDAADGDADGSSGATARAGYEVARVRDDLPRQAGPRRGPRRQDRRAHARHRAPRRRQGDQGGELGQEEDRVRGEEEPPRDLRPLPLPGRHPCGGGVRAQPAHDRRRDEVPVAEDRRRGGYGGAGGGA